jgi:outer membrane protein TolC
MRRPHAVEQANLQQQAAEAQLAEYRTVVAYQVTESLLRRDEVGKRLEMARHELLAAEEGTRLVQRRYENSLSLFIELLEAQTNLNRNQAQLVDQETDYAVAGAHVLHSAGIFLKEFAP